MNLNDPDISEIIQFLESLYGGSKVLFKSILILLILAFINESIFAGTVKGCIIDSYTHENVIGAIVSVENHINQETTLGQVRYTCQV